MAPRELLAVLRRQPSHAGEGPHRQRGQPQEALAFPDACRCTGTGARRKWRPPGCSIVAVLIDCYLATRPAQEVHHAELQVADDLRAASSRAQDGLAGCQWRPAPSRLTHPVGRCRRSSRRPLCLLWPTSGGPPTGPMVTTRSKSTGSLIARRWGCLFSPRSHPMPLLVVAETVWQYSHHVLAGPPLPPGAGPYRRQFRRDLAGLGRHAQPEREHGQNGP